MKDMTLFTVGPVQMYPETLRIEGTQQPYFRTPEFSTIMKEIERDFLQTIFAPEGTCFFAMTCSGTGAMDAAVSNILNEKDKVLIINGGSFGNRFAELCVHYHIPFDSYTIPFRKKFDKAEFERFSQGQYSALLVNACETSTGQKYDLDYLGEFCRKHEMLFIVDAVSAYLADSINMSKQGIDVFLTASQKALALSPGLALVALSQHAKERLKNNKNASYYFNFETYLENQKRGQPPFTSAVGTVLALHQRLKSIVDQGVTSVNREHAQRAAYFRTCLESLPVELPDIPLSNCCTPVLFPKQNASIIYEELRKKYGLVLTPSGGHWKDLQLRVGHLGALTLQDYDYLTEILKGELLK